MGEGTAGSVGVGEAVAVAVGVMVDSGRCVELGAGRLVGVGLGDGVGLVGAKVGVGGRMGSGGGVGGRIESGRLGAEQSQRQAIWLKGLDRKSAVLIAAIGDHLQRWRRLRRARAQPPQG